MFFAENSGGSLTRLLVSSDENSRKVLQKFLTKVLQNFCEDSAVSGEDYAEIFIKNLQYCQPQKFQISFSTDFHEC